MYKNLVLNNSQGRYDIKQNMTQPTNKSIRLQIP